MPGLSSCLAPGPRMIEAMSKTELNHYLVLGVEPDATQAEIEDAFERSSTQRDESVAVEGTPAARSERIEEAYAVLRDPARRAEYDKTLG